MGLLTVLLIVLAVIVLIALVFAGVRRSRRSGSVLASNLGTDQ